MASENIHLFDEKGQDWFKILTEYDHQELSSIINDNELKLICSEQGNHGLRYWNNKLEYSNDNGATWTEIQTGSTSPSEISDINGLQDALDLKVDDSELIPIQQNITDIQSELVNKGEVKSVNGTLPDANGNVAIDVDTQQIETDLQNHIDDNDNPHNVTKEQVGLSNVDNTADIDKPISTLVQTALDDKADKDVVDDIQQDVTNLQNELSTTVKSVNGELPDVSGNVVIPSGSNQELDNHIADTNNPHNVTALQVGLENVDNTSDLDKPISTATQTALDSKFDSVDIIPIQQSITDLETAVALKGDVKTVNGITPDVNGNIEIQTGGSSVTVEDVLTSNSSTNALSANMGRELKSQLDSKANKDIVTDTTDGLMPSTYKVKIDGIEDEANHTVINDTLTSTSTDEALSANMGKTLSEGLNTHESKIDVVNEKGHVQIDDITIKLNADGKIYSVGGGGGSNVVVEDTLTSTSADNALSANQGRELKALIDTKTSLPISADDVTDTINRVLLSPNQRGQIDSNTSDINSHSQRIATLEQTIGSITSTDEKVKMNTSDVEGYLGDKLDNTTIQNVNNKLVAMSLSGLDATIYELNLLKGASVNIQEQIDSLSSITNVQEEIADTENDLPQPVSEAGSIVLVREDSTQDGSSTFYRSNGTDWIYVNRINSDIARDFTTNPINLDNETTGLLPKLRYEKQNASETPITDSAGNLTATNVEDAIAELFTYANNLKSIANVIGSPLSVSDTSAQLNDKMQQLKNLFADNLVDKGIMAYGYNTVEELINKIPSIANVTIQGIVSKVSKLNITAPYEVRIPLNSSLSLSDITTTPIEFIEGSTGVVHYNIGFDNGDISDFEPNDKIEFDGVMKLKTDYEFIMTKDNTWTDDGAVLRRSITKDEYARINKIEVI